MLDAEAQARWAAAQPYVVKTLSTYMQVVHFLDASDVISLPETIGVEATYSNL